MALGRRKITVVGAGNTGATTAFVMAQRGLGDIVLVDIPNLEGPTKGKALDQLEGTPLMRTSVRLVGTSDYAETDGSDLIIITAGIARKPGMSRDDLVTTNAKIVKEVTQQAVAHSPDAVLIVLSNPVDAMTYQAYVTAGLPRNRVIGQAGVLDSARFRTFIAEEVGVAPEDVTGFTMGVHGDDMVPITRLCTVGGIPVSELIPKQRLDAIVERTRQGGGEIVNLFGNGSAYYAPALSLAEMADAVLNDKRRVLSAIVCLEGEYGYHDLFLSVPCVLGAHGIERILEVQLTAEEKEMLDRSAQSVANVIDVVRKM